MSIKTNAEIIRDETVTGANTAVRVGTNLIEIADDLIGKQTEIDLNTNKVSFDSISSTRLANTSGANTGDETLTTIQTKLVSTNNLGEGINNLYFLASRVLSVILTGLSNATNTVITATDTVLIALGKLQGQLDLKANDLEVVKLTGNQNIEGEKTFINTSFTNRKIKINSSLAIVGTNDIGQEPFKLNAESGTVPLTLSNLYNSNILQLTRQGGSGSHINLTGETPTNGFAISGNLSDNNGESTTGGDSGGIFLNASVKLDTASVIGGQFTSKMLRTLKGTNQNLSIGIDSTAFSNITDLGSFGYAGRFTSGTSKIVGVLVKGATLQNADLLQIQDSSAINLIKVSNVGNLITGTLADNGVDKLQVNGSAIVTTLKTSGFTVATLPAPPAQGLGARAHVTDALNPTYLGTLTGGGTVKCPVFYNGTAWVSA